VCARVRACVRACVRLSYGQLLRWQEVVSVKPDASRSDSAEIYFLGKGFGAGKKPPPP
jgi:site-specific recombinase XerC